jgi:hypothetical protein
MSINKGTVRITGSSIHRNLANGSASGAGYGGGIHNSEGDLIIETSSISRNTAAVATGGVAGGIFHYSHSLIMIDSVVEENTASSFGGLSSGGGGINIQIIDRCSFSFNHGGGLSLGGTHANYTRCKILSNSGHGVRVWFGSKVTFDSCDISSNRVVGKGGGISVEDPSEVVLRLCNLSHNVAVETWHYGGQGGAIFLFQGRVTVISSTLHNNVAESGSTPLLYSTGGAIYSYGGDVTLIDSICSSNTACMGGCVEMQGTHTKSCVSGIRFNHPQQLCHRPTLLCMQWRGLTDRQPRRDRERVQYFSK